MVPVSISPSRNQLIGFYLVAGMGMGFMAQMTAKYGIHLWNWLNSKNDSLKISPGTQMKLETIAFVAGASFGLYQNHRYQKNLVEADKINQNAIFTMKDLVLKSKETITELTKVLEIEKQGIDQLKGQLEQVKAGVKKYVVDNERKMTVFNQVIAECSTYYQKLEDKTFVKIADLLELPSMKKLQELAAVLAPQKA